MYYCIVLGFCTTAGGCRFYYYTYFYYILLRIMYNLLLCSTNCTTYCKSSNRNYLPQQHLLEKWASRTEMRETAISVLYYYVLWCNLNSNRYLYFCRVCRARVTSSQTTVLILTVRNGTKFLLSTEMQLA